MPETVLKQGMRIGCIIAALATSGASARAESSATCHASGGYIVVERERDDFNGMNFLVKTRPHVDSETPCTYQVEKGDFEIDVSENAFLFWGLSGRFLVLNSGMSAMRTLVVYDLDQRKPIFEATTTGKDVKVADQGVSFWLYTGPGTAKTCKQYREYAKSGLMPVVETRATFDFASGALRKSTETHCTVTQ